MQEFRPIDPLTEDEKQQFLEAFCRKFYENYQQALQSGAIDTESLEKGDYTLAKCVLYLTAVKYKPTHSDGINMLQNLQHFVG